ncbi:hypothetical protein [Rhodopirellula sallentina]|uniref:Uncharacterized protein n=1 Tax=Rhodopirellula sallentina SM41 TaxID=1263870 RepID=M5UGE5_9BACT|nr:hypothetical protein [Rhodopirellula sallentina]EMI55083.1 hypothetical protein RSSM_03407 [Rhodopirellula sallentina SM41]
MNEVGEQRWWTKILSDAYSVDPLDFWERTKLLCGIEAACDVEHITREQADYARKIFLSRAGDNEPLDEDPATEEYHHRIWQTMLIDAKHVDKDDPWERTKIFVGMTPFSTFGIISQEQFVYIRTLLFGEAFGESDD